MKEIFGSIYFYIGLPYDLNIKQIVIKCSSYICGYTCGMRFAIYVVMIGLLTFSAMAQTNVKNFGAIGDGVTDDTNAINTALAAGSVYFPEGKYKITSKITIPKGQRITGASRYTSKIIIVGAINGIEMGIHTSIEDLRIIGNSSMTTSNACVLAGSVNACCRSAIRRCIIGGQSTSLGDAGNVFCSGDGVRGGANTFLMNFYDVYFVCGNYGYQNLNTGTQVNNALLFAGCEFHANVVGAAIIGLCGVKFSQCTFEGNFQEGLIIGNAKGCSLDTCYFESNNMATTSTIKSDLYIGKNATLTGNGTQLGTNLSVRDCIFFPGPNSVYGIYIDGQRNVDLLDLFFASYSGNTAINVVNSSDNTGNIDRVYVSGNSPIVLGSLTRFHKGSYSWTGYSHISEQNSLDGVAFLGAGANTVVYYCSPGETYLVTVGDADKILNVSMTAIVQCDVSGHLVITILQSCGTTLTDFYGAVKLWNNTASACSLAWSITRIK